ncbi:MAG: recombinase family protein, partial [Actinobacteria bacterium]|nr:recombinase family protein [Actinomycetota bacterium]
PDRLSRNAGDLGALVDLMDQGKLQEIKTYSQSFRNQPNDKFLLMILCSQAKLENDNKSVNVKRGIRTKCEMGWRPSPAPLGYMNRTFAGIRDVITDRPRAEIIKQAFEKLVYQNYSGNKIKEFMDRKGFTTKQGKQITISMIYLMLKNPFYYGYFEFPIGSGKWYKGAHEPIITKELFDQAQKELGTFKRKGKPIKDFALKSIFTCYSCDSSICGEERYRKLTNGRTRPHIYYHCTRGKNRNCKEGYITEKGLIKLIIEHINKLNDDQIIIPEKLKEGVTDYKKIVKDTLYFNTNKMDDDIEVTNKDYAKYILNQGSMTAKRELTKSLPIPRRLHKRQLIV